MDIKKVVSEFWLQIMKKMPWLGNRIVGYVAFGIVGLIIGGTIVLFGKSCRVVASSTAHEVTVVNEETQIKEDLCDVKIDVNGAVVKPGVYCISSGTIIDELLIQAGGLSKDACVQWVSRDLNRAEVVEPNSKIFIPSKSDVECSAANPKNSNSPQTNISVGYCPGGKISLNKASLAELDTLSGVGLSTAQKIVDGRPYKKLEDLMEIKGIGEATFAKLKEKICL